MPLLHAYRISVLPTFNSVESRAVTVESALNPCKAMLLVNTVSHRGLV